MGANNRTIYAHWNANKFTIIFDGNDKTSGSMNDKSCTYGQDCILTANAFSKTGYTFGGWTYNNTTYNNKANVKNITSNNNATVTMKAKWNANKYKITYNSNGGTDCSDKEVTYGTATGNLCASTKTGYTLLGWEDSNGTLWTNANTSNWIWNKTTDVALTAKWEANTYTITYNSNGGSACSNKKVTYGTATGNLCASTKANYTLLGWEDSNGTLWTNANTSNWIWNKTTNVTLTAKWEANTYTVTYNKNGGTGSMTSTTCNYGENCALRANSFTKSGYSFAGWSTSASATSNLYSDSGSYKFNQATTLYAIWKKTITVTFNANGSNTSTTKNCYAYNSATSCSITSPTISAASGFTALGWNTSNTATSSAWAANSAKTFSANATYYAITKSNSQLTINFDKNTAAGLIGTTSVSCYRYNGASSCSVTSPDISHITNKAGETITTTIGFNTNSNATTSAWNVKTSKSVSSSGTYYAIVGKKKDTFTVNADGGMNVRSCASTSCSKIDAIVEGANFTATTFTYAANSGCDANYWAYGTGAGVTGWVCAYYLR